MHKHARTQVHATPPHVGNTLALLRICASDGAQAHWHARLCPYPGLAVPPFGIPPPDSPGSLQPSGKTPADPQVSQQHADSPESLHYLCHMAQPLESCIISLSFIILYFVVGAGAVWEAALCPVSRPGPRWIVTSDRNTLGIKLEAFVQVQCSKKPP